MDIQRLARVQDGLLRAKRVLSGTMLGDGRLPRGTYMMLFDIQRIQSHGDERGVKVSDLAARGGVSVPAVSQTLRSLEQKGLVERTLSQEDRRVVYVRLTAEGERMLDQATERFSGRLDELLRRLGSEDTEQLLRILGRLDAIIQDMRREEQTRKKGNDR